MLATKICLYLRPGGATRCKWRIPDGKGGEWCVFMFRAQLRTTDTGLMGPTNLVALTVIELDDTLPRFMDVQWDSVWATHGLPIEVLTWNTALG
jgi:hypothetical protein